MFLKGPGELAGSITISFEPGELGDGENTFKKKIELTLVEQGLAPS